MSQHITEVVQKGEDTVTTTLKELSALFLTLPYEIQRRIVLMYLLPEDAVTWSTVLTHVVASNNNNNDTINSRPTNDSNMNRINVVPLVPMTFTPSSRAGDNDGTLHLFGSSDEQSATPDLLGPRIHLPTSSSKKIHSVTLRTQWKDQGHGFRKGQLFIIASPKLKVKEAQKKSLLAIDTTTTSTTTTTTSHNTDTNDDTTPGIDASFVEPPIFDGGQIVAQTSSVSPHEWEDVELTFYPNHHHHIQQQDGRNVSDDDTTEFYYHLWYRIGGGGGHHLFLRNITLQFYIFDDIYSTFRSIHEKLYTLGCIGNEKKDSILRRQNPFHPWDIPRFTQIRNIRTVQPFATFYLGTYEQRQNVSFYPKMLLRLCESYKHKLLSNHSDTSIEDDPVLAFLLNDYGIPITTIECIDAVVECIQSDIDEWDQDWLIYNENSRLLRERLHISEHNIHNFMRNSAANERRPRQPRFMFRGAARAGVIPLDFQQQFFPQPAANGDAAGVVGGVNGFRLRIPARQPRNNDNGNNHNVENQQNVADDVGNNGNGDGDNMGNAEFTASVVVVVNGDEDGVNVEPIGNRQAQPPMANDAQPPTDAAAAAAGADTDTAVPPGRPAVEAADPDPDPATVVNHPDGSVTINIGNIAELAANAIPIDFQDMQQMNGDDDDIDMELPNLQRDGGGAAAAAADGAGAENDPDQQEIFGIARAAMAAVFGFNNDGNNNNNNNNFVNGNNGFPDFFQQANFGNNQGGFGGTRVFVAGGGGGFGGNNGPNMFPFDMFNNMNAQQQRPPAPAQAPPQDAEQNPIEVDVPAIAVVNDEENDMDEDAEEVNVN